MTEFEKYVIDKIDKINDRVNKIDKRLAVFVGKTTVIASIISTVAVLVITKIF
jgi:hypothetical protein